MMNRVSAATLLADEIERTERGDPNSGYDAKLTAIRWMQGKGTPDRVIEELLQVKLRPADRRELVAAA